MAEGFFRSKKGFTVVQNEITRDVNISLKAKGLYLVIQAYISMPDKKWTKEDFMRLAKEGKKAFDSAWKELKESGYLKVHIMSDNGRWRTEYELLDEPEEGPHTLYHNADGKVTSDNLQRAEKKKNNLVSEEEKNHYPQNGTNGIKDHYPPFGSNGNGSNGYGSNGNHTMEEKYSMEFIEQHYELEPKYVSAPQEKSINTVKDVLYDVLNTQKTVLRVMGEDKPASVVKSRLLKLNRCDIDYAIDQYQKQVTKVHNHKAYMLTVLYQAKSQGELDISNRVMYDFYGAGRKVNGTGGGADG